MKLAIELGQLADNAVLKAQPQHGDEKCEKCRYYLENTAEISYCWHPKLRILVAPTGGASGGRRSPKTPADPGQRSLGRAAAVRFRCS